MKILKHGDMQPRKFTCTQCKCIFIADKSEYEKRVNCDSLSIIEYCIDCPDCGYSLLVDFYDAPLYTEEQEDV